MSPKNSNNDPQVAISKILNSATVLGGAESLRPRTDVAFDIETAPARPDLDDSSLLDAETARVAAIGYLLPSKSHCFIAYDKDESAMLKQFWELYMSVNAAGAKLIGFNVFGFDLPVLIRRSWLHGIMVPRGVMTSGGRYWSDTFVDLMAAWKCGSYRDYISLDKLARFLGVGEKTGSGEMFYKLWDKDRAAAIDYLANDVKITHACAQRMGVGALVEVA